MTSAATLLLVLVVCGLVQAQQPAEKKPEAEKSQGTSRILAAAPVPKKARERVITNLAGFDLLASDKPKQTTVVGGTRAVGSRKPPVALAPRLGKLYGASPTFRWSYSRASSFTFVLRDESRKEVFRAETPEMKLTLPQNQVGLEPGKTYFWTVETAGGFLGGGPSAPVGFLVLEGNERQEVEQALSRSECTGSPEQELACARLFTERRLWYDAITAYSGAIRRHPDRAELYEERGMIYSQLDITKAQAEQDFLRADELQKEKPPK